MIEQEIADLIMNLLDGNTQGAPIVTDTDRELAKMIYASKRHLGPLGMIEIGIAMQRLLDKDRADGDS